MQTLQKSTTICVHNQDQRICGVLFSGLLGPYGIRGSLWVRGTFFKEKTVHKLEIYFRTKILQYQTKQPYVTAGCIKSSVTRINKSLCKENENSQ